MLPVLVTEVERASKRRAWPVGCVIVSALCLVQSGDRWAGLPMRCGRVYGKYHQQLLALQAAEGLTTARLAGECAHPRRRRRRRSAVSAGAAHGTGAPEEPMAPSIPPRLSVAIRRSAEHRPSPEALATLAVLNIVTERWDWAIAGLSKALAKQPQNAELLNDLGAAYLGRATAPPASGLAELDGDRKRPPASDLIAALDTFERSLERQRSLPGLFNAALTLERLGLGSGAAAAWRQYLHADAGSGWGLEAGEHLAALRSAVPRRPAALFSGSCGADPPVHGWQPWTGRQVGERALLGCWAERLLRGDGPGAEAALRQAEAIASALDPDSGRLLTGSLKAIREAQDAPDKARLSALADGHRDFASALRLQRSERSTAAHELAERAVLALRRGGSPFELRALLLRAASAPAAEWAAIGLVERHAAAAGYVALQAEAQREAAYRMGLEGRLEPALAVYTAAHQVFLKLGENEPAAVLAVMLAEIYATTRGGAAAPDDLGEALSAAPEADDPWDRYSIYTVAANAVKRTFPRASSQLHQEAAAVCAEMPERPLCAADSLLRIAQLSPDAGVAADVLKQATAIVSALPASDGRERTLIDLKVALAQTLGGPRRSTADQEHAAAAIGAAALAYEAKDQHPAAARAYLEHARILEQLGRVEQSAAEYRQALEEIRRWDRVEHRQPGSADRLPSPELRQVYESLIDLDLSARAGPSRGAFLLAEEMHGHPTSRPGGGLQLPHEGDIARWLGEMPPGMAVLEFSVGGKRPVAWILAGGHLDQVPLALRPGLPERISRLVAAGSAEEWRRRAGDLYQELMAPALSRLPAGIGRLVVIPDGPLAGLPFRALWDGGSGRYLDESYRFVLAPSLDLAPASREVQLPRAGAGAAPTLLSLGVARFAAAMNLAPLPGAVEEAAAVRAQYGGPSGCVATDWQTFRRCAPLATVIHLATHAAAGPTATSTWLAFAGETVALDRLWHELPRLTAHPLVILSSCESLATSQGAPGLGGLARPFLAKGARAVVGTLWKIDDKYAAREFATFHHAYRRTGDLGVALQEERRCLSQWRDRPWAWAGLETVYNQSFLSDLRTVQGEGRR